MSTPETTERSYDVVVIGAGSTGENVADRVVQGGLSAVVVESALVGGECSYWACMPSKALLRSGQARDAALAVDGAKQAVTSGLDVRKVLERRDAFTSHWKDDGQVAWLEGAHIDLVRSAGRLSGVREVTVTADDGSRTVLRAEVAVVLATGSQPLIPPIDGLAGAKPWTAPDATSAQAAPERLVILGGGVVGVEMATAWNELGAEVVLVEGSERVLSAYEPFVSEAVGKSLAASGVEVHTGVHATAASRDAGRVTLTLDDGTTVSGTELLVAVGRAAGTDELGLETVGLTPGDWLDVDETMLVPEVDGGWLYAAGDVNHRALLTHMGKYQARIAGDAILARHRGEHPDGSAWAATSATADTRAVPQVVFTTPEVASVGLTAQKARDAGITVRTVEYEIGQVAGAAVYADGYEGHAMLVVDEDRKVLVGATMVGAVVGEMLHAATIAVVGEVPMDRLRHAVPSYPTISEVWLRLLTAYGL